MLPDIPETASNVWLTAEEKQVAIQRTRKSGNTDEKSFDKQQLIAAITDYKVWFAGKEKKNFHKLIVNDSFIKKKKS